MAPKARPKAKAASPKARARQVEEPGLIIISRLCPFPSFALGPESSTRVKGPSFVPHPPYQRPPHDSMSQKITSRPRSCQNCETVFWPHSGIPDNRFFKLCLGLVHLSLGDIFLYCFWLRKNPQNFSFSKPFSASKKGISFHFYKASLLK
jgi:hypothetical protein